jgi:hypothetical protein
VVIVVTIVSKKRDEILKRRLTRELTHKSLRIHRRLRRATRFVGIIENSAADSSFGNGEAQFLTGDLG